MQDIESYVMSNYHENMLYFENKHPSLWKKLKALELLLGEGKYPQRYDLEYKNDYFDVVELSSGGYLYNANSESHSQQMAQSVNFKKYEHTIETFYHFNVDDKTVEAARKLPANFTHAVTAPLINYYNKNAEKSALMKKIYKFIFIGVGLGLHLEKIDKKVDSDVYFIIENDIELFRLSLFTCNYKNIFHDRDVFFSIAQNPTEFNETFVSFYEFAFIRNHYLKFSLFSSKDEIYIKNIQSAILTRPENCYSHAALLEKGRRVLDKITEDYKFLSMLKKNDEFFKDKPILVLGAGPSLGANKEWLVQNHDKFIIIAPFVALRVLYHLDIAPDIIVHIDEGDEIAKRDMKLYEGKSEFFDNSLFIFNASVPEIFFDTFKKESIYLLEDRTHYKLNNNYIEAASVGETAYTVALSLTDNDVYMLGLDLSVSDDGKTHNRTHNTKGSVDTDSANRVDEGADLRKSVLEVRGNFREKTYTIPLFAMSINIMNMQTKRYKSQNQKVYNLSDGAYFEQTIPLRIDDIEVEKASSKEYGAVHTDYYHTFYGYCKESESDKIFDIDVILDGEVIKTVKADKDIERVANKFDVDGHSFEFYLDEKYFDKPHLLEFKSHEGGVELVGTRIKSISRDDFKYNEYKFMESLYSVHENEIKDSYCKDSIGFIATDESLKDKEFIGYIKELIRRLPHITVKAFYFNMAQKELTKKIFENEINKIDSLLLLDVKSVPQETSIFISHKSNDEIIRVVLETYFDIIVLTYTIEAKNMKLSDSDSDIDVSNNILYNNKTVFNLSSDDFSKINYNSAMLALLTTTKNTPFHSLSNEIDTSTNLHEFNFIQVPYMALTSKEYFLNYVSYIKKYKQLINKR